MPPLKRIKTNYPGVFYIEGTSISTGKLEKIFYIRYRKAGKMIEEKAGRQFQDDMTAARAARIRAERIEGKRPTRKELREFQKQSQEAELNRWTLDRLWSEYKERNPGLKGFITDENRYVKHIKPVFGGKEPQDLTPFEVDKLRLTMLKTHKPGTVKNILELLRRLINFGVKKHLCQGAPFKFEMPKVHNLKTEDLTPDQLSDLLEAIEQDPNTQAANFMRMALFTGMRRGELFRLKGDDIDFERNFIHLRTPKGGEDQKIPLNPAANEILANHPRMSEYVFPGRGGKKRTSINKQVNRIKEAAGLPKDFRPLHGLRHVYASMLASSGQVDLYTLQKLLTHKSPQMTMRYAHLRDEALRRASDLAGDLLTQAVNGKRQKIANLKDEGSLGRLSGRRWQSKLNPEYDEGARLRYQIESAIIVSLAGCVAEAKLTGRFNHKGASADYHWAVDCASRVTGSNEETGAYVSWLWSALKIFFPAQPMKLPSKNWLSSSCSKAASNI
jgi:integrase